MSIECSECEMDARSGHSEDCSIGLKFELAEAAQRNRELTRQVEQLQTRVDAAEKDTARLDAIAAEYWKLDPFEMPTGAGDADVGWRIVQYHQGKPEERTVAEVYTDDPRRAIDAALTAPPSSAPTDPGRTDTGREET